MTPEKASAEASVEVEPQRVGFGWGLESPAADQGGDGRVGEEMVEQLVGVLVGGSKYPNPDIRAAT